MLSAYAIGQMEKALQQPPVMAALIDAQDRVRRFACDFCAAAFLASRETKARGMNSWVQTTQQWLHDGPFNMLSRRLRRGNAA